jgi:3-oxoacyl-[acyl-carrier protein] reductase
MLDGVVANMVVAVEMTQRVIDPMVRRKFGRIVNITSGTVKMPQAGLDLSSGARAGLTAFLAGVARSVAASNVTINFILPARSIPIVCARRCKAVPRSRASPMKPPPRSGSTRFRPDDFGEPQEIGALLRYLCSAHAGFITGQSLVIDGGASRTF